MGRRPLNVLWILCDELRADALSFDARAPDHLSTPALDALAERGVVFDRCYVNSPVCVPARVAMHTGLLPEQTGVYNNEAYAAQYPMAPQATFPEAFAEAGWTNADFGKEHVPRQLRPWQLQDPRGSLAGELLRNRPERGNLDLLFAPDGILALAGTFPSSLPYPPSAVVDHTLGWMAAASEPFLVRASFLQPHTPVIPPEPWASTYLSHPWPDELDTSPTNKFERRFGEVSRGAELSRAELVRSQGAYHGLVAWVDYEVSRLLDGLECLGLADRTAIVFTSDHGRLLLEQGGLGKHTFAPGSQRVPLVVVHPDLAAGHRTDLAQHLDLPRTICGLAGIEPPAAAGGRDLFGGAPPPERVTSTIGYGERASHAYPNLRLGRWYDDRGWPRRSCVRTERWRYERNVRIDGAPAEGDDRDAFLTDTLFDSAERENLVDEPRLADLVADLESVIARLGDGAVETPPSAVYPDELASA